MPVLNGAKALARKMEPSADWERWNIERFAGVTGEPDHLFGRTRSRGPLFPVCANPHCNTGWLHLGRRRSTPVFEGGWCCSPACTRAQMEAALRREMDGRGSALEMHRHRVPLGLAMLEQGWITAAGLRRALEAQKAAGCGRLGQWLVRGGMVSEAMMTRALGLQWNCPVLALEFHDPEALSPLAPRLFLDAFGALPLRVAAGKLLYLGFEERLDPALALGIERMTGLRVESGLVEGSQFGPAHTRALEAHYPAAELIEAASEGALARALAAAIERLRPVESRLVRVHDCLWLRLWLRRQPGPVPHLDAVRDLIGSAGAH